MAAAAAAPTTTYREVLDSIRSTQIDDFAQRKERLLSEFGIEARPAEDIQSVEGLLRELEERLELEDSGGDEALDDPRQRGNLLTLVRLVPLLGLDLNLPAVPQPDPDAAALAAAPLGGGEGGGEIVLHPNHRMLIACVRRNFESRNKKLNLKKRKKKAIFFLWYTSICYFSVWTVQRRGQAAPEAPRPYRDIRGTVRSRWPHRRRHWGHRQRLPPQPA